MKYLVTVTRRAEYTVEAKDSTEAYKAATSSKAKKVPASSPEESISVKRMD